MRVKIGCGVGHTPLPQCRLQRCRKCKDASKPCKSMLTACICARRRTRVGGAIAAVGHRSSGGDSHQGAAERKACRGHDGRGG
jgi:hypothetical protein